MTIRIGVDLGGTKIEAVALDEAASSSSLPRELARHRRPTNADRGYEHILDQARLAILEVAKEAGVNATATPIGVGMPGARTFRHADGTKSELPLVKNANTTVLNGRTFFQDLEKAVGRAIAFANDANCFALAEATWGAARGARVAFGVILGTGVGGGVVLPRENGVFAWEGAQSIAGEWGHVPLEPVTGPPCYCGRRGCTEMFLSGPAIEKSYAERAGRPLSLPEIAAGTATDEIARTLLSERMDMFGRAISTVINILDPDVVVLGGGVSNIPQLYTDGIAAAARWVFNDALDTKLVKNALGDSAGVLGAALL